MTAAAPAAPRALRAMVVGGARGVFATWLAIAAPTAAVAAESGSVCIAPVPTATAGMKSQANDTASATPYTFTVAFDGGAPIAVSHDAGVRAPALAFAPRHRVRIVQAGVAKASFGFRFAEYGSDRLCLWFNPLYETWSLSPPGRMPWCRCAR